MTDRPSNSGISRDDWLRALNDAGLTHEDDQEAVTINEFAELFGIPRSTAQGQLMTLVKAGKAMETRKAATNSYGRRLSYRAFRLLTMPQKKGRKH